MKIDTLIDADLLIFADWIIPVIPKNTVLENSAIAIKDGKIIAILDQEDARARVNAKTTENLANHVLIPGLVNAHGHIPMALFRGIADDIPLQQWLEERIWPLESRFVSAQFVSDGSMLAVAEMISSGTTTFADMYFFPEEVAKVTLNAGIRAQLASPVMDFPTVWAQDPDEYIAKATNLHDQYRHSQQIFTAFGPHAPYTVSDKPLQKLQILADELDIPIHMHVHENAQEIFNAVASDGRRPLQRLADLGLISPRLLCVHATQLLDEEIALLSDLGASVVHCPGSNLKLASGFCEIAKLLAAGVNVALGTDGAASNNDLDMLGEIKTAATVAKAVARDASAVPAHQALALATINGARAMGLADKIGSLEINKFADITAIDLNHLNTLPMHNPASHVAYAVNSSQVSHVWCNGQAVLKNSELKTMDPAFIREKASRWRRKFMGV
ncbi:MAG: 5-methylthioadenosine/S-adenosylhomocysteine deaminase [Paracoccaceae bacterium]